MIAYNVEVAEMAVYFQDNYMFRVKDRTKPYQATKIRFGPTARAEPPLLIDPPRGSIRQVSQPESHL